MDGKIGTTDTGCDRVEGRFPLIRVAEVENTRIAKAG